jgi:hypothetical protein
MLVIMEPSDDLGVDSPQDSTAPLRGPGGEGKKDEDQEEESEYQRGRR